MKKAFTLGAKKVALVAVMTATIEGAKLALGALPNIEAVTLLCAVYGYVFGGLGILATSLFVVIETFIYPIHSWVIYYAIHWNAVCLTFWLLGRKKVKSRVILTLLAFLHTAFFGVETSLIDTMLFTGFSGDFWARFAAMYVRGTWFYVAQIACNLLLFPITFLPLAKILTKAKQKFLNGGKREKVVKTEGALPVREERVPNPWDESPHPPAPNGEEKVDEAKKGV